MQRGSIWWATLPEPVGSEPGYQRPIVIIQADRFNQSRLRTVLGVALTTNLDFAKAPGNILLPKSATSLSKDSVAIVTQLVTVDKSLLIEKVSELQWKYIQQIEEGLRLVLDL